MDRIKRKLDSWRCYRHGHHHTFSQIQEASRKILKGEDGTMTCKRCGKETDIKDCTYPQLAMARLMENNDE